MKFRRLYPIALAAIVLLYASLFLLFIILPSFVLVKKSGNFEISVHGKKDTKTLKGVVGNISLHAANVSAFNVKSKEQQDRRPSIPKSMEFSPSIFGSSKANKEEKIILSTNKPYRPVTKSLAEIGYVSGRVNPDFLFFNRVPKCGSEMLVLLLQWLQGRNGFKHIRLGGGKIRRLKRLQQEELIEDVINHEKEALPLSFDRHVYWLNFSSFDHSTPVWINLIRDPVEKAASRFYYAKELHQNLEHQTEAYQTFEECVELGGNVNCRFDSGKMYDLTIPYFCGHEKWCMVLNDEWALEEAKSNVERYYSVVGVLEDMNATLSILEKKIPRFFSGVQEMYFSELLEPHHNKNRKRPRGMDDNFRSRLKSSLKLEYEFYNFIKSRLHRQLSTL